jgi:hypothetical protein
MLEDLDDVLTVLGRLQDGDVSTDDFGGGVAEDPLGAPVPASDDAIEGLGDDGIVGRFDDGREHLPQFLGPLPPGDITGDRHDLAGFALGVQLFARLTAHQVASWVRDRTRQGSRPFQPLVMAASCPPGYCIFDASNRELLHFVERDLIAGAVVKLGVLWAFVVGDLLGMLDGATVFQVGGDAGGPEGAQISSARPIAKCGEVRRESRMESDGGQAMGTSDKKKGGPPPADTACQWSTEDRSLVQEIPPFNTSTVGRPDSPAWGQLIRMLYPGPRNSQGGRYASRGWQFPASDEVPEP